MPIRINRKRIAALATAGLIAAGAYAASADAQPGPQPAPAAAVDLSNVAVWAKANGYSGLSPASLGVTEEPRPDVFDLSGVAAWAEVNNHTGGSPASLRPIGE